MECRHVELYSQCTAQDAVCLILAMPSIIYEHRHERKTVFLHTVEQCGLSSLPVARSCNVCPSSCVCGRQRPLGRNPTRQDNGRSSLFFHSLLLRQAALFRLRRSRSCDKHGEVCYSHPCILQSCRPKSHSCLQGSALQFSETCETPGKVHASMI